MQKAQVMMHKETTTHRIAALVAGVIPAVTICAAASAAIWLDVCFAEHDCAESGLVEWCQFAAISFSGIAMLFLSLRQREERGGLFLAAAFFLDMAIREQDGLLDNVFHGFWAVPVSLLTAFAFWYAWRNRTTVLTGLERIRYGRGFPSLALGVFTVIGFSRLLGYKGLWRAVGDYSQLHAAKRIIEESVELFGYLMIAMWAAHFLKTVLYAKEGLDD